MSRDGPERPSGDAALTQPDELLEVLASALPEYTFIYDEHGTYLEAITGWERGTERYLGDELVGENVADLFPGETAEEIRSAIREALETGEARTIEYPVETETDPRWYEGRLVPIPDGYQGQQAVLLTAHRITERREYERQLSELHDVAATLATSDSVTAVCEETLAASEEILNFDISVIDLEEGGQLVPIATSSGTPPDGASSMSVEEGLVGLTYRTGESFLVADLQEHEVADPQGPYRSAISIPLGDHGVFQAVHTERDAFGRDDLETAELLVTHATQALDRLEHERSLERQNERLEEFAALVSHDLRNPLNVARGQLELAREDAESNRLDAVASAHERMDSLIEDMLDLARGGQTVGETEPVDLADLVDSCWRHVATESATLEAETEATIEADRDRLRQLLENLLRNASEHGGPGVTVRVGDLPGGFYVEDDGPGIPPEEQGDVLTAGYTTADDGTGLGLSIVREIAEAHDWEFTVTNGSVGGARFEFSGVERHRG